MKKLEGRDQISRSLNSSRRRTVRLSRWADAPYGELTRSYSLPLSTNNVTNDGCNEALVLLAFPVGIPVGDTLKNFPKANPSASARGANHGGSDAMQAVFSLNDSDA